MRKIISNGSKWMGQEPDSIETLLDVLAKEPLDASFEDYGNFIIDRGLYHWTYGDEPGEYVDDLSRPIYPDNPKAVRFFGNFLNLSHVFAVDTDEPEIINRLTKAIRENQNRADYGPRPTPK